VTHAEVEEIGAAYFGCAATGLRIGLSELGWSIDLADPSFEASLSVGWTSLFIAEPSGAVHQIPECPPL